MDNKRNSDINGTGAMLLYVLLSCAAWIALIIAKTCGVIRMSWIAVLLGAFWLPAPVLALSLGLIGLLVLAARIKRKYRRKRTDRRIIRQAKILGAWDKRPTPLGGRALELKAKACGLKRAPEETDWKLRARIAAKEDADKAMERTIARIKGTRT